MELVFEYTVEVVTEEFIALEKGDFTLELPVKLFNVCKIRAGDKIQLGINIPNELMYKG